MNDAMVDWPELEPLADGAGGPGDGLGGGADEELLRALDLVAPGRTVVYSVASTPLRCLDPGHSARCLRCVAPPADADADDYVLRSGSGRSDGDKVLRALLVRTDEWQCADAREAAACRADAAGLAELAVALRTRNIAALRKRTFFALCRYWSLRSDVWGRAVPRGSQQRSRQRSQSASSAPSPPLGLVPAAPDDLAAAAVRRDVGSAVAAFLASWQLPSLSAAAAAEPGAPLATLDLHVVRTMQRTARGVHASLLEFAATLRESHAALLESGNADVAAWRLGASAPPHAEHALHTMLLFVTAGCATNGDVLAPGCGVFAALGRPLSSTERAHLSDLEAACGMVHMALSVAQSAVSQLRLGSGSVYLSASLAVLEGLADIAHAVGHAPETRLSGYTMRVPTCHWHSTMLHHVRTLGLHAE